jgi:UDP-glucose 4-epimerase
MSNVLLTGGTGYIGSHTAVVLAEAGHEVVLYDNLCNSKRSVLDRLETITGRRLAFIEGDVRDTGKLKDALSTYRIDAVIHFAGLKAVGEAVENPIEYYDNNVIGSISLLQAMRATHVRTLVFSSSATVYGEPKYLPLDEEHPTNPTNPYGRSKLQIEEILADVANGFRASAERPWGIVCLRYFNPVGAHNSGLIGEDPQNVPNNLMPYIAQVAAGKLPKLNVFGNDYDTKDGTGVRDYIHVMDLAEGHRAALDFLGRHAGWHAINLGTGSGYSVLDMIKAFSTVSGQHIPYVFSTRREGDIATCFANAEKAREQLGWQALRDLQDMCVSAWRAQQQA